MLRHVKVLFSDPKNEEVKNIKSCIQQQEQNVKGIT